MSISIPCLCATAAILQQALLHTFTSLQETSQGWPKPSVKEEEEVPALMLYVALIIYGFNVAVDWVRERTAGTL